MNFNIDEFIWVPYKSQSMGCVAYQLRNPNKNMDIGGIAKKGKQWYQIMYIGNATTFSYSRDDWEPIEAASAEEARQVAVSIWRMS